MPTFFETCTVVNRDNAYAVRNETLGLMSSLLCCELGIENNNEKKYNGKMMMEGKEKKKRKKRNKKKEKEKKEKKKIKATFHNRGHQ